MYGISGKNGGNTNMRGKLLTERNIKNNSIF